MTSTAELLERDHNPKEKICAVCGQPFTLAYSTPFLENMVKVCGACSETHMREDTLRVIANSKSVRMALWKQICPPDFQEMIPSKLPRIQCLDAVMKWEYGPRGLILHGPTDRGKSRIAWHLMKREFEAGRSVKCLDAAAGFKYASMFSRSPQEVEKWIDSCSRCGVLFLDDTFKAKLTESFESALFAILSARSENRLPVVIALNDTGETMAARMSEDRGLAMVRRLKEFCTVVNFGK